MEITNENNVKTMGKFTYNNEHNRCFISGNIQRISPDRCIVRVERTGSKEVIICCYRKGKNKLPHKYNVGDYVVFSGKITQSKFQNSSPYHLLYIVSAFEHDGKNEQRIKNNCEITGYISSYKKIGDELVEALLQHSDKQIKLYFKRNYRFMLYDFENKYHSLPDTHTYIHGYFKLDGIWVDNIREFSKMSSTIEHRLNAYASNNNDDN